MHALIDDGGTGITLKKLLFGDQTRLLAILEGAGDWDTKVQTVVKEAVETNDLVGERN